MTTYRIEVESRHIARLKCRVIPSASAIGTMSSKRAVEEKAAEIADGLGIGCDFESENGFYVFSFESDTNLDGPAAAARKLNYWLSCRSDFAA